MAPVSYYYLLSLILTGGAFLWLFNLLFISLKGRTAFGKISTEGTPGHDRLLKLASRKNILLTIFAVLILLANLTVSIFVALSLKESDKYILLISMPIVVAILYTLGALKLRKDFKTLHLKSENHKKNANHRNKDDSWLS